MSSQIDVIMRSGKRGSNPGGVANIQYNGKNIPCYLKYCDVSKISGNSPLKPHNQPAYEGLTFCLARRLGLHTPEESLLRQSEDDPLHFIYLQGFTGKELNHKKPLYFTSGLLDGEQSSNETLALDLLASDKLYRDLLALGDVSGRRQNVYFPRHEQHIVYLDLGCSFVDSQSGQLSQRNMISKLPTTNKKRIKNSRKRLDKVAVTRPNGSLIELGELIEGIPKTALRVHSQGFVRLEELLDKEGTRYIQEVYTLFMPTVVKRYKSDDRVIRRH